MMEAGEGELGEPVSSVPVPFEVKLKAAEQVQRVLLSTGLKPLSQRTTTAASQWCHSGVTVASQWCRTVSTRSSKFVAVAVTISLSTKNIDVMQW